MIYYYRNQIGKSFPIQCESHPDVVKYIKNPQQFQELSPDGGCSVNIHLNYYPNLKSTNLFRV
jgi:hypothetical protein